MISRVRLEFRFLGVLCSVFGYVFVCCFGFLVVRGEVFLSGVSLYGLRSLVFLLFCWYRSDLFEMLGIIDYICRFFLRCVSYNWFVELGLYFLFI